MESSVQTDQKENLNNLARSSLILSCCLSRAAFAHTYLHPKEGYSDAIENLSWYASIALVFTIHCDSHSLPSPKEIRYLGIADMDPP